MSIQLPLLIEFCKNKYLLLYIHKLYNWLINPPTLCALVEEAWLFQSTIWNTISLWKDPQKTIDTFVNKVRMKKSNNVGDTYSLHNRIPWKLLTRFNKVRRTGYSSLILYHGRNTYIRIPIPGEAKYFPSTRDDHIFPIHTTTEQSILNTSAKKY